MEDGVWGCEGFEWLEFFPKNRKLGGGFKYVLIFTLIWGRFPF